MKPLHFIFISLMGAILVFSILPFFNYNVDQWRVLHHDFKTQYRGIEPNKSFLKVDYLIENKNKYDTLLMGSSRMRAIDAQKVSPTTYNMTYSFGIAATHLHNLKILLKNDVKVKNIILGLNDYIIWKNPSVFESDFLRRPYELSLLDRVEVYLFYLFKKPAKRDIDLFKGKSPLIPSDISDRTSKNTKRRKGEQSILARSSDKQIKKIRSSRPASLGYRNENYRIDDAINEVEEFVKLCHDNEINLKVLIFPTYKSTFLKYNQNKVAEFKHKLADITNYYDFYRLNELSLNELNWKDTSHFFPSTGDKILLKMNNDFLVTKENVNVHLNSIADEIRKNAK